MLKKIFLFVLLTFGTHTFAFDDAEEPPRNQYLSDSPWPMTHRNPYCQASSPNPGPVAADFKQGKISEQLASAEAVAITLNLSSRNEDNKYSIWASARNWLFKLDANDRAWKRAQNTKKPHPSKKPISGAYTVLDLEGNLFVPRGASILVFREAQSGVPNSHILKVNELVLPTHLLLDDEVIVGLNMTYDGHIVGVTNRALIVVFSRSGYLKDYLRLSGDEVVSNSLAIDEDGGIYGITDKKIYRVNWLQGALKTQWQSEYPSTGVPMPGRLGVGSGTTPTLMGFGNQDKLVLIADGSAVMNIIAFWRDNVPADWAGIDGLNKRVAGISPIKFGRPDIKKSITEQSLLVRGYGAVAVNNDYGDRPADARSNFWTILFSNRKKYAPYGIEKFRWNPVDRRLESVWANPELSVPNGIPTMSAATGLIYYVGQHEELWTVEGVDWQTGQLKFRHKLGDTINYNSFFAGMEIGYDSDLISGVFGGALRLMLQSTQ